MNGFTVDNHLFMIANGFGMISILAGFIMVKFPPKKINSLYGYRTSSSMKNQERWDFSQIYSAKEMIKIGFINIFIGMLGIIYYPIEKTGMILGLTILFLSIIILLFRVEVALKRKFREDSK